MTYDCRLALKAGLLMGRQVNFWMTADDERAFVERLTRDDIVWSEYSLPFGSQPVMKEFAEWIPKDEGQRLVLVRRGDWGLLKHKDIDKTRLPLPPPEPWTMVGTEDSPCIEWDACVRRSGVIGAGRIYFQTTWLQNGAVHKKAEETIRWFDRLARWIRQQGQPLQGFIAMPNAYAAAEEGNVKLESFLFGR